MMMIAACCKGWIPLQGSMWCSMPLKQPLDCCTACGGRQLNKTQLQPCNKRLSCCKKHAAAWFPLSKK